MRASRPSFCDLSLIGLPINTTRKTTAVARDASEESCAYCDQIVFGKRMLRTLLLISRYMSEDYLPGLQE